MTKSQILKSLLALVPVFLLAIALPFAVNRLTDVRERQTTESRASSPTGTTSLSFVPATAAAIPGATLPVNVQMAIGTTPGNRGITGVKAILTLTNTAGFSLTAGSNSPSILAPLSVPWNYVHRDVVTTGNTQTVTIEAIYLDFGTNGFISPAPITLATLNLRAGTSVAATSLVFSAGSEIRAKLDNSDILSSTFATGNFSVALPTPTPVPPTPTRTPTPIPPTPTVPVIPTPTRTPTPVPPTPTLPVVPTPTRTPTPIPPTPTPALPTPTTVPATATLNFSIAFQGVNTDVPDKPVTVALYQGATQRYNFTNVDTASNASGVFSGSVGNILPGSYDVFIKGPIHLRKRMTTTPINLTSGANTQNWSATRLLVGDLDDSNTLELDDITSVVAVWVTTDTPVTPQNSRYDVDDNGIINLSDVTALIANWTVQIVNGD